MKAHEFEIRIERSGEVRVHMKGVKGKSCEEYAKWLASVVGPVAGLERTAEAYEPDSPVHLDVRGSAGRSS